MQKLYASPSDAPHEKTEHCANCDAYYLASEVDTRIAELERLLREAHYFMGEDFQFSGHWSDIKVEDVCATPRYLQLWKDLNKALGL